MMSVQYLPPIPMLPAFRGGNLTPWGGDRLKTLYGKDIPCVPCGESLELSAIPGLESTAPDGVPLSELIRKHGEDLIGRYAHEAFPLLLKLIDARECLSVQVHPSDDNVGYFETGKLGKTEAWLILDAPPGAEIIYGLQPGITRKELERACEGGRAVEFLLRRVPVQPGDVCYIPSGCIHALTPGLLVYEIQQSSDVTYRFYDWDRVGKDGSRRPLHIAQALTVCDLQLRPEPVRQASGRAVDSPFFTLDLIPVHGSAPVPAWGEFGILTSLDSDLWLNWESGLYQMKKGETCILPKACPPLVLEGNGRAALSTPGK